MPDHVSVPKKIDSFVGRVFGVHGKTRDQLVAKGARYKGGNDARSRHHELWLLTGANRQRQQAYRSALLLTSGELIQGPNVVKAKKEGDDVTLTFETWVLLGPFAMTHFVLLSPELKFVSEKPLEFALESGVQKQFTIEGRWGLGAIESRS